ncbi:MAG: RNA methyltransferase [Pseudanabaenaceae cyanobacterium]
MRIVLVETAGPLNLGAVARVMQNFGLRELYLVNPQCSPCDPQARQMAVHAQEILDRAQIVPKLIDAIADCDRPIATTGRIDRGERPLLSVIEGCEWLKSGNNKAIVFGREDRGLSNQELQYFPRVMTIPSVPKNPSLNLAQSVAICCYQWRLTTMAVTALPVIQNLASVGEIESFFRELEKLLLEIGFLYPHTAFKRMEKIRCLFHKQNLTKEEVAILRGIIHQVQWAIANGATPAQNPKAEVQ